MIFTIQARKVSRGLKAIMRLRSLVQGHSVKRQVASTLKSMQTLAHVQSEVRARRVRMSEENQDFQRQLCNKREKDHEKFRTSVSLLLWPYELMPPVLPFLLVLK